MDPSEMRWGAYGEEVKAERLFSRLRRRWWVFVVPLYPFAWAWILSFFTALFIHEPLQWDHQRSDDQSYMLIQILPFKSWPAKHPVGTFSGAAMTKNLQGVLETSDVWEIWLIPVYFQVARRLAEPLQAPPSLFYRNIQATTE